MKIWVLLLASIFLIKLFIGNINTNRKKIVFLILSSIAISFVMGCSHHSLYTSDLSSYYNYYDYTINTSLDSLIKSNYSNFEIGYVLLNKIFSSLIRWPQFIIIIESIICTSCLSIFIYKNSKNVFDSIIYYLGFGIFKFQLTGFRQSIAMSICLLSIEFIKKRKFIPFLLTVLLAMSFHKSAVLFLPAYFLLNSKFSLKHYLFLILSLMVIIIFKNEFIFIFNTILGRNYSGYVSSQFDGIAYIVIYLSIIIMSLVSKKDSIDKNRININMCWIALMLYITRYTVIVAERASVYFSFGAIVALPNLYNLANRRDNFFIRVIAITLACILFIHKLNTLGYNSYLFFWQ